MITLKFPKAHCHPQISCGRVGQRDIAVFWGFLEEKPAIYSISTFTSKPSWRKNGGKDGRNFNREDQNELELRDRNNTDNQGAYKERVPHAERPSVNGLKLRIAEKYLENQVFEDDEFHANFPKLETFPTQDHSIENVTWDSQPFCLFKETINKTYDEICHYRKNIFKIPSGKAGKMFIE